MYRVYLQVNPIVFSLDSHKENGYFSSYTIGHILEFLIMVVFVTKDACTVILIPLPWSRSGSSACGLPALGVAAVWSVPSLELSALLSPFSSRVIIMIDTGTPTNSYLHISYVSGFR